MRIEIKRAPKPSTAPTSTGPDVEMSEEQRAALEKEKQELLADLGGPRKAKPAPDVEVNFKKEPKPEPVQESADHVPEVAVVDDTREQEARAAAEAERQRVAKLKADLKQLEADIKSAEQAERIAAQNLLQEAAKRTQQAGAVALAPYIKKLKRHRDEVARLQAQYGPILREAARSMASGSDPVARKVKQDAYGQAGLLGQRLGDTRAQLEDVLRRVTADAGSSNPVHHAQAKQLADVALGVSVLALETEVASLVQSIMELNPNLRPTTTPDRVPPSVTAPRGPIVTTVDFGRGILG